MKSDVQDEHARGEMCFVRHGQASYGAKNYDKLSDLGHVQSGWLGQHLSESAAPFDRMVRGDLRRHKETAACVLSHLESIPEQVDPRLNEMSYFVMEQAYIARTGDDLPTTQAGVATHFARVMRAWESGQIPEAAESFQNFQSRVLAAITDHARAGERVLVISSGGPLGIVMRHVLKLGPKSMSEVILSTHNASFSRFLIDADDMRLYQYNATPHLDMPDRLYGKTFL